MFEHNIFLGNNQYKFFLAAKNVHFCTEENMSKTLSELKFLFLACP